jgi:hypothetical protein
MVVEQRDKPLTHSTGRAENGYRQPALSIVI